MKRLGLRTALSLTVACVAATALVAPAATGAETAPTRISPRTPIEHLVTVMQEGHTFDNYFGSYPGAAGIPPGACMPVSPPAAQPCVKPFPLGKRPLRTLARDESAFDVAHAAGAMDGFVSAQSRNGVVDEQAMGTYQQADITYYWNLARSNVLFDEFFASAPGGSVPNHLAWIGNPGAQTAAETIPATGFGSAPTLFDELETAGISWKFYVQNYDPTITFRRSPGTARGEQVARVPLLAYPRFVDDPKLFAHIVPVSEYFEDLQRGTLPAVSYIVPSGPSERAPTNVSSGARFVQSLAGALSVSSAWPTSAFVLTYDGWGGYYDHVAPRGTGFRVPTLLMSPYARRGYVDHSPLQTTSIPGFVEDNWGLKAPPAGAAAGLGSAFDFTRAPRRAEIIGSTAAPAPAARSETGVVFVLYGAALLGALAALASILWRRRGRTELVLP